MPRPAKKTPGTCGVRSTASELARAIVADVRAWPEGTLKRLAFLSGVPLKRWYRSLEGHQPITGPLLEEAIRHTGGAHVLAHLEALRPAEGEACATRATRASGELAALIVEDLADDGRLNRPATFEAARSAAAESGRLVRVGAALRARRRAR